MSKLSETVPVVSTEPFGQMPDGTNVSVFTLTNQKGMRVNVINYGAIITECWVPDQNGKIENLVLGFNTLESYLAKHPRFGATIGRYANRIANAEFDLDSCNYKLAANNGPSTIHGGIKGFDKQIWQLAETGQDNTRAWVKLCYLSKDMEEGFPGNLNVSIEFSLSADNSLTLSYSASTDKATPINLTNHSYFNLRGAGSGNILDHLAKFNSGSYTPLDSNSVPTGEIKAIASGDPYDFRTEKCIGSQIGSLNGGYDINYVVGSNSLIYDAADTSTPPLKEIAHVSDPSSARKLITYSDQPGFQFFTANSLDGSIVGNGGSYAKHAGFCIETQHFADSVHHPEFPSTILRPAQEFRSSTRYHFTSQ